MFSNFKDICLDFLTLCNIYNILIDPVNIIISCNSMHAIHYKCVLLITYKTSQLLLHGRLHIVSRNGNKETSVETKFRGTSRQRVDQSQESINMSATCMSVWWLM